MHKMHWASISLALILSLAGAWLSPSGEAFAATGVTSMIQPVNSDYDKSYSYDRNWSRWRDGDSRWWSDRDRYDRDYRWHRDRDWRDRDWRDRDWSYRDRDYRHDRDWDRNWRDDRREWSGTLHRWFDRDRDGDWGWRHRDSDRYYRN